MEIREKISLFMKNEDIEVSQIARNCGKSQPTISNYINGKREIPLSFILWFLNEYKNVDPRKLFNEEYTDIRHSVNNMVAEDHAEYGNKKQMMINKITKIIDEFMHSDTNPTHKKIK